MLQKCKYSMSNTGVGCFPLMKEAQMIIAVPTYDSLGNKNFMDLSAGGPFDAAFFADLVNAGTGNTGVDPSKRWYPLPQMKNAKNTRAESITQSFDDNTKVLVEQGVREITLGFYGKDASPKLFKQIKSFQDVDFSIFIIDIDKNIIGADKGDGNLYPLRIDKNSWDPVFNPGVAKEVQNIMCKGNFHKSELDENLSMVAFEELDADPTDLRGLLSVTATFANLSYTGTMKVTLNTEYGSIINPQRVVGLVAGDMTLKNITTNLAVAITTAVEETDNEGNGTGIYDLTFAAQTAADVAQLTITKPGFDFASVTAQRPVLV